MIDRDPVTPLVAVFGLVAQTTLADVNTMISIAIGLATLGFVLTRWQISVRTVGGWRKLFRRHDSKNRKPPEDF